MLLPTLLLLSTTAFSAVLAQTFGTNCSQENTKLSHGNYQLSSDCDAAFFCAANQTCANKGCRREDFPYGYPQGGEGLPPKCGSGEFCPDEEDLCQTLLPVDSPCQLNRDDECAPPDNAKELAGPRNTNGAICLNFQCMWANATLGNTCIVENIAYIAYDQTGGKEYINIVSRGNCKTGLYCDAQSLKCMSELALGAACTADKECISDSCMTNGKCGLAPNESGHVAMWVYIVVGIAIVGAILGVMVALFLVHRKARAAEQERRAQYWREQEAYRNNILSMREQARASLLSLPSQSNNLSTPRGGFRDDYPASETSQTGILSYAAGKSSGLRNNFSDEAYDPDSRRNSMEEALVASQDDDDFNARRRKPSVRR